MAEKLYVYPTELQLPDGDLVDVFSRDDKDWFTDLGETRRHLETSGRAAPRDHDLWRIIVAFDVGDCDGEFKVRVHSGESRSHAAMRLAQCCATIVWVAFAAGEPCP